MNNERIEVLNAIENECKRKLLAVATPCIVLDHVTSLEKRAEEIFDEAQKIRQQLVEWTEQQNEIIETLLAARVEKLVLRTQWAEGSIGDDFSNRVYEMVKKNKADRREQNIRELAEKIDSDDSEAVMLAAKVIMKLARKD